MEAESGQITVKPSGYTTHCEWRTWWIQQDIRELQFGQDGKPMSLEDRDRSNFHSVPDVAVSTFSPKVTQDTTVLDPHKQTFHGSLNLPYENEKTREPDIAEFIHRLPFSKLLPIFFLFKQQTHVWCSIFPFENAPAEHLHGYHGNYQVASSVPEAETASKKANTVVYCFFLN